MNNASILNQLNTIYPLGALTQEEQTAKIKAFGSMELLERTCFFTGNLEEFKPAKKLLMEQLTDEENYLPGLALYPEDSEIIDIKNSSKEALSSFLTHTFLFDNTDKNWSAILNANKVDVNFTVGEVTLLRMSAAQLNVEAVHLLLSNGADVMKSSPLRLIARSLPKEKHSAQLEIAKALIQRGASVLTRFQGVIFKEEGYSLAELTIGADLKSLPQNCAHNSELKALFDKQITLRNNLKYVVKLKLFPVELPNELIKKITEFTIKLIRNDL